MNRPTADAMPVWGERIGPYEVVGDVAQGGMASVLKVIDSRTGTELGMKLLLPLSNEEETRSRFRREFRALSRMNHPNILNVFEWGLYGQRPWFTMELIEGRTMQDEVALFEKLAFEERFARAESILTQVARALSYIHDRGLVHRDVTPGNIMVRGDGRVKLMDFGVVKDLEAELTKVGEVIGTVAYIAPEQISGESVDARADLYSLGAVLYLLLTGQRPFSAHTMQGYLEKHLHEVPRAPRELVAEVPEHLNDICLRLLAKEPADRYASAEHLLHVLNDSPEVGGAAWPRRTVGRRRAKAALREALDQIANGNQGVAIRVCGGVGQGKTRLLELAEAYARRRGLSVGRGICRAQDRPFGAFSRVYRALGGGQPHPVLEQVLGDKQDQDTLWERYPIMAAFRELLVSRAPCVVILDGLERADPATVELLEYVVRNTLELMEEPIVYIVAQLRQPGEERTLFHQLSELKAVRRIDLGPLDASEVEELVLSLLDNTPASLALAERLYQESEGSPALITDMVRGMLDEGTIVPGKSGRHHLVLDAAEITRSKLPMPASLRQALKERLAPLPAEVMDVARVLAVARRRVDLDTVVALTGGDEEDIMDALDELVDAQIVIEEHEDEDEWFALNQSRLRDVLLEDLSAADLCSRHRRFGEVLEQKNRHRITQVVEELAHHFEHGGVAAKAYTYLLLTATKYLHRSLYEESLEYTERALKLEPAARLSLILDIADRRLAELLIARSQAQFALGRWADAIEAAKEARRLAQELKKPHLISRAAAEVGLQLRNLGQIPEAERELREALMRADEAREPALRPGPLYQLAGLVWGMGNIDEAESLWNECLKVAIEVGDERAQGSGYNGLGILAICRGRTMEARRHLEESAALFERLGMLGPLAITRVNLVELYLATGILKKAMYLAERTVAQAREVFHAHGIALGLAWRAHVLLALGRLDDAKRDSLEAIRLVRQLGTAPEDEVLTMATLVLVNLARDEAEDALEAVEELLPSLADYDYEGIRSQVAAWHAQALAVLGRKEEARQVLEARFVPEQQWPHVQVKTFLAVGIAWERLGALNEAKMEIERALQVAEAHGFRYYQLLTHHLLIRLTTNEDERARHIRVASSLSRSLAASLARRDADHFSKVFS